MSDLTQIQTGFGAISDAAAAESKPDDAKAPEQEQAAEVQSPLLEEPGDDGAEDSPLLEGAEEDPEPEEAPSASEKGEEPDKKAVPLPVFKRRLRELAGQREAARIEARTAKQELARLEGEVKVLREVNQLVSERFRNDPDELRFVDAFMAEIESRAKVSPQVKQFVTSIVNAINANGGNVSETTTQRKEEPTQVTESKAEALAVKLATKQARNSAVTALLDAKVDEGYAALIADAFVSGSDLEKLAEATPEDVYEFARSYLREKKIPVKSVLKRVEAPKDPAQKRKPNTSGARRGGAEASAKSSEKPDDTPRFKSREEFDASRRTRLVGLIREMGLN